MKLWKIVKHWSIEIIFNIAVILNVITIIIAYFFGDEDEESKRNTDLNNIENVL